MIAQKNGLIINISAGDNGKYLHNVAAMSLYPGFVRTERVLQGVEGAKDFALSVTHSPQYTALVVAALAADLNIMEKSGRVLTIADLAKEYRFTDIDED